MNYNKKETLAIANICYVYWIAQIGFLVLSFSFEICFFVQANYIQQ